MVGVPLVLGVESTFHENFVQMAGTALWMNAGEFRRELTSNDPLRTHLLCYMEAHQAQISQTAACNGRHDLEQRLARWLLMVHDRIDEDELPLTQEFIATMLGVHRPSISVTLSILQHAELIRYANGHITILDPTGPMLASGVYVLLDQSNGLIRRESGGVDHDMWLMPG